MTWLLMIVIVLLLITIGGLVAGTIYVSINLTHLLNAINKRMLFMLIQQNDILAMYSEKNVSDLEEDVNKLGDIIRDIDKPTPGEKTFDPFKDGDMT